MEKDNLDTGLDRTMFTTVFGVISERPCFEADPEKCSSLPSY